MRILVIGSGAREHALCWKLKQSPRCGELYCAPGNAGIQQIAQPVSAAVEGDFSAIIDWAKSKQIDLVVVGPEEPLSKGIVDRFAASGIRAFGPVAAAARIESSKAFAKDVMAAASVPTAQYRTFTSDRLNDALAYLDQIGAPIVIKADGLAAGKGVTVAQSLDEARQAVRENLSDQRFGEASQSVLIEEFLQGEEASVFAFCDGERVLVTQSAQDHKAVFDNDQGPNTGGMGAYSPAPVVTPALTQEIEYKVIRPVVAEMSKRGVPYVGVLYAGLIMTADGPKVIEFNCRLGDPETQVILPRLKTDLIDLIEACLDKRLDDISLEWTDEAAVCVVMAAGGYPDAYKKGQVIKGLELIPEDPQTMIFHAGTKTEGDAIVTNGGRVLGLTTLDVTLENAIRRNYDLLPRIQFEGAHWRTDIGQKALRRKPS